MTLFQARITRIEYLTQTAQREDSRRERNLDASVHNMDIDDDGTRRFPLRELLNWWSGPGQAVDHPQPQVPSARSRGERSVWAERGGYKPSSSEDRDPRKC